MRKYTPLIGCLRRNPSHNRFPIPNAVWEYKLKAIEFMILSYLCCCRSHKSGRIEITAGAIASAVHLTEATAKKYLDSLSAKELVSEDGTPTLNCKDDKFFTLPNEIFLLNLPPSAFVVYAYLLLIEDRKTHTCHPSYNTISAAAGMSKNTVIKSIGTLLEKHLITMEHSQYLDWRGMKWNGNNLYTILPTQRAVSKFHQQQLNQLELEAVRRRIRKQQEKYDFLHPRAACTPPAPGVSDPTPAP